jgi:hypothetical protein
MLQIITQVPHKIQFEILKKERNNEPVDESLLKKLEEFNKKNQENKFINLFSWFFLLNSSNFFNKLSSTGSLLRSFLSISNCILCPISLHV